ILTADLKSTSQLAGTVSLKANGIKGAGVDYSQLQAELKGSENQHNLRVTAKGQPSAGQLVVDGSFNRHTQQWQGKLHDSHLTSPIGTWNMSNAAAISYAVNNGQATIGPHCWQTKGSKLCLPKQA